MTPSIPRALITGSLVGAVTAGLSSLAFGSLFSLAAALSVPSGLLAGIGLGVLSRAAPGTPWMRRGLLLVLGPLAVLASALLVTGVIGAFFRATPGWTPIGIVFGAKISAPSNVTPNSKYEPPWPGSGR